MKALVFSRSTVLWLWTVIAIYYIVNAAFLVIIATLYLNFSDTSGALNFLTVVFLYSASAQFLETYHKVIGVAYALLAVPFFYGIAQTASWLLSTRFLKHHSAARRESKTANDKTAPSSSVKRMLGRISGWVDSIGLTGKYSTLFLIVVETIEAALQTWQAYRTSKYIGSLQVNQLYGIMIFINCWSTAIIHYVWEHRLHRPLMARFLSVLADVVLDFTWGVVLQGMLFWRYWRVFLDQSKIGDMLQVPETPDRELRQILVLSKSNFLLSAFPFFASSMVMHDICSMLKRSTISSQAKVQYLPRVTEFVGRPSMPKSAIYSGSLSRRAFMIIMGSYGTVILVTSITASRVFWPSDTSRTQCIDPLYPWFTRDVSCVGRTINCTALGLRGYKAELTPVLESFSPYLLGNLAFTDCAGLEMPTALLDFGGVQTIAIRRSSLLEWTSDVAITNLTFSELQSVQMIDSTVQCRPAGIMQHRFPASFEWLRLKSTDANGFIHDVHDAWWSTHYFHCIDCGLTTVPRALEYMNDIMDIEIPDNALTTLPASLVRDKLALRYVVLAGNAMLHSMEEGAWALVSQLFLLDIQGTDISTIPADAASSASPDVAVWAFGTPLCTTANENARPPQVSCQQQLKSA